MQTFRYFAPSSEEQRAFAIQFAGTIAALVVLGILVWRANDAMMRSVAIGAGLGAVWLLVRAAWQLELKARRSATQMIGVADDGLHLIDGEDERILNWADWQGKVRAGKLVLTPKEDTEDTEGAESFEFSARETEEGMQLIESIARHLRRRTRISSRQPISSRFRRVDALI